MKLVQHRRGPQGLAALALTSAFVVSAGVCVAVTASAQTSPPPASTPVGTTQGQTSVQGSAPTPPPVRSDDRMPATAATVFPGMDAPPPPEPKEEPRSLAIGVYTGFRPDLSELGNSIVKDGTTNLTAGNILNAFGGTTHLIQADKDDEALYRASQSTNSAYKFLSEQKSAGALMGLTLGLDLKYDFNDRQHLPFFVKVGVDYTFKIMGGTQERTLGSAIDTATPFGPTIKELTGGTEGGRMKTVFDASWVEVPLSVGMSVTLPGGHRIYAGFGVSYFNGGFSTDFDMNAKYVTAATTFTDGNKIYAPLERNALQRKVSFNYSGVGPNFLLGAEGKLGRGALFLEWVGAGATDTVYSNELSEAGQRFFTAVSSSPAGGVIAPYNADPSLFKRIAFPVVLGGLYFRLGYRFYVL
jgi:hypothetical protein